MRLGTRFALARVLSRYFYQIFGMICRTEPRQIRGKVGKSKRLVAIVGNRLCDLSDLNEIVVESVHGHASQLLTSRTEHFFECCNVFVGKILIIVIGIRSSFTGEYVRYDLVPQFFKTL